MESLFLHKWLDEKGYGFASRLSEDGTRQTVFCHSKQFRGASPDGDGNVVLYPTPPLEEIHSGVWIQADVHTNTKGLYAKQFVLQEEWDESVHLTENRPTYRVIEVTGRDKTRLFSDMQLKERVICESRNLSDIEQVLPTGWREDGVENRAAGRHRFRFEKLAEGQWVRCEAPIRGGY